MKPDPKPEPKAKMSAQEYRIHYFNQTKKKNKYNAKHQEYGGKKYDSNFEAKVAEDLDWQLKAGDLVEIKRQVKIPLSVNGVFIANYYMDFRTVDKHGGIKYIEVKGLELPLWKMKWRLLTALIEVIDKGAELVIVKQ